MTRKALLILIAACFSISVSFSQDKLLLINGKEYKIKSTYLINQDDVVFSKLTLDSACIAKKVKSFSKKLSKDITLSEGERSSQTLKFQDSLSSVSKLKSKDKFDVFAIEKSDGTEKIIYAPDTANGDPSVEWVSKQHGARKKFFLGWRLWWRRKLGWRRWWWLWWFWRRKFRWRWCERRLVKSFRVLKKSNRNFRKVYSV